MSVVNVRNAHISFMTEGEDDKVVYGKPEPIKYVMKVEVTPESAQATNYGDGVISDQEFKLQGANLSVEWNRIPLDIQAKMFGREIENGEMVISTNDKPKPFAFGYEEEISKGKSEYCWYYDCIANPISKSSEQSTDSITYGSDTLVIAAKGRAKDGKIAKIADTTDPSFKGGKTWFANVDTI